LTGSQVGKTSPGALAWHVTGGQWQAARHLSLLNRKLLDVAFGRCPRLAIFMPPRHGKSYLASQFFPAWFLGSFPSRRVILSSYEASFAASWGRKVRDVLTEHGEEVFGLKVRADSSAADRWDLEGHAGGMITSGVGGAITGRGADLLVVDDPVKNAEEAMSQVQRDRCWEWFLSTAYTRLEPAGAIVLIQTRWHVDDLAGRILKRLEEGGEQWNIISLPAFAEEGDILGRKPGEALWPDRYPAERLEEIRKAQGAMWFQAMYQQSPTLAAGNLFRRSWFKQYVIDGDRYLLDGGRAVDRRECYRFAVVDPAASEKQSADYTAIGVFMVTPQNDLLVLDMVRERLGVEGIVPRLRLLAERYNPGFVIMEANGFQVALAKEARRTPGIPAVREVTPESRSKLVRATPAIIRAESGQIFLPERAAWVEAFLEELATFTGMEDRHDDQVDVLAYAARQISKPYAPYPSSAVESAPILGGAVPTTPGGTPIVTTGGKVTPIDGPGSLPPSREDHARWWRRRASPGARRLFGREPESPDGYRQV
jgi:predicted phage terminase large subunit-like protein